MPLIEARGLTKKFRQAVKEPGLVGSVQHFFTRQYREKLAVDHIELDVEAGESVAYLGPNGAGKSTTIKMLTGILVPTSGRLVVDGLVPYEKRQQNARNIGVVFGQRTQLWWDIPVVESFNLARDMYEIPAARYKANLAQFTELLGLGDFLNVPAAKISLGQRMRADLCMALLHDPPVLYLDEPTIGLDIAVKDSVRRFVRSMVAERGTTVMLTTHDLGDIEDICKRIVIIDNGRIIHDGDLGALKDTYARDRVLHFDLARPPESMEAICAGLPACSLRTDGLSLSVRFDRFQFAAGEIAAAVMPNVEVVDFRIDEPEVEDLIRKVYLGQLDVSGAAAEGATGEPAAELQAGEPAAELEAGEPTGTTGTTTSAARG
jgi:ABC-2 type transport system ATP-binding protein